MKPFLLAGLLVLLTTPWASAQYIVGPAPVFAPRPVFVQPPIAPVVSYSYYPPAPVYAPAPFVAQSAPVFQPAVPVYSQPVTTYYGPAPVVAPYGYSQTTTYGLGIFRPRGVTTYYGPYWR